MEPACPIHFFLNRSVSHLRVPRPEPYDLSERQHQSRKGGPSSGINRLCDPGQAISISEPPPPNPPPPLHAEAEYRIKGFPQLPVHLCLLLGFWSSQAYPQHGCWPAKGAGLFGIGQQLASEPGPCPSVCDPTSQKHLTLPNTSLFWRRR